MVWLPGNLNEALKRSMEPRIRSRESLPAPPVGMKWSQRSGAVEWKLVPDVPSLMESSETSEIGELHLSEVNEDDAVDEDDDWTVLESRDYKITEVLVEVPSLNEKEVER